jgi:hypothetical protein
LKNKHELPNVYVSTKPEAVQITTALRVRNRDLRPRAPAVLKRRSSSSLPDHTAGLGGHCLHDSVTLPIWTISRPAMYASCFSAHSAACPSRSTGSLRRARW